MADNVDRLKVRATIIVDYDIIPMENNIENVKDRERNRSIEDMISLLKYLDSGSIKFSVEFEEVNDAP